MKPETPETNTENQTQQHCEIGCSDLLAQFNKLKLAHYACVHFESSSPKYEELEGLFIAKLDAIIQLGKQLETTYKDFNPNEEYWNLSSRDDVFDYGVQQGEVLALKDLNKIISANAGDDSARTD